jgi:hypothetical protein
LPTLRFQINQLLDLIQDLKLPFKKAVNSSLSPSVAEYAFKQEASKQASNADQTNQMGLSFSVWMTTLHVLPLLGCQSVW